MAGENFNARAQFEVDVAKAIRDVNQLTTTLARLGDTAEGKVARQLSRMEKQTVNMAGGLKTLTGQTSAAAAAQDKAAASAQKLTGSQSNLRYALYDVATTWGTVATATLGAAAAAAKVGVDYQSAFASVQRTSGVTGSAVGDLRTQLVDLSTALPTSFANISEIATLGGQLGIAASGLQDFTRVTAQLTATTDLSAEAAGTALGRFQALLKVPSTEFENLASSVLKVGVNSVATETQIVNIATQISSMGAFAGLTADQVVGLSGALASVGAQPELSRGTITRVFTQMSEAVSMGGDSLAEFARLSGVSAAQFQAAWGTDQFASVFQKFLNGIADEGQGAVSTLSDLGITSVRDVPLLLRLAGAQDVVSGAFSDAASGYADASELQNQYGIVSETVASKLTTLGNTIKAIIDSVTSTGLGPFSLLLDLVQNLAEAFLAISRNPVGQFFLGLAGVIGVGIGALAAFRSAQALTRASLLALRQAEEQTSASAIRNSAAHNGLVATMARMAIGTDRATAAQVNYAHAQALGLRQTVAVKDGFVGAATAVTGFGAAAKGALVSTGIGAAIVGITSLVQYMTNAFKSSEDKAKEFFGDFTGLAEALKADTSAYEETGKAIRTITTQTKTSSSELAPWAVSLQNAAGAQVQLSNATRETTDEVNNQIIAIGENTRAWLAQQIANNEKFQQTWRDNGAAIQEAGFNLQAFLDASLNSQGGGEAYLQGLIDKQKEVYYGYAEIFTSGENYTDQQVQQARAAENNIAALEKLRTLVTSTDSSYSAASTQIELLQGLLGDTSGVDDASDSLDNYTNKLKDAADAALGATNNTVSVQNALYTLGQSLYDNGAAFDAYSVSGRENLGALSGVISAMVTAAGDDSAALASMLQGLINSLASYGVDAASQLGPVLNLINQLTGGKGTAGLAGVTNAANTAGNALSQGFAGGAAKAAKSAKNARKEVKTLSDYVSDLEGVFNKVFEFRFGLDQSIDKVAEAYQSIVDSADEAVGAVQDATQAIIEADAKITGLNAENNTLSYQLSVAQEYGDALRATEIIAKMAENNAELQDTQKDRAKSEKDLQKAQNATSKSLDGTTVQSREQREQVLSLVQAYQDQVAALANQGLSQQEVARRTAELKNQFISQLTQMGYNRAEVDRYAAAFDDLTYSILNVPRKITVDANTEPAQRALNEFLAKVSQSSASASLSASGGGIYNASGINVGPGGIQTPGIESRGGIFIAPNGEYLPRQLGAQRVVSTGGLIKPIYRASGGTVAPKGYGPQGTDTVPAWLTPDEFVQRREAVRYYGLPFMNAINNMQVPRYLASGGPVVPTRSGGGGGGIQLVELLPNQIQQIAAAVSTVLSVDGKVLAATVNSANGANARRGSN